MAELDALPPLIRLACDCFVAPECITEVTINREADTITVRMRSGIGHCIGPDYGQGVYRTADRITAEINAARAAILTPAHGQRDEG